MSNCGGPGKARGVVSSNIMEVTTRPAMGHLTCYKLRANGRQMNSTIAHLAIGRRASLGISCAVPSKSRMELGDSTHTPPLQGNVSPGINLVEKGRIRPKWSTPHQSTRIQGFRDSTPENEPRFARNAWYTAMCKRWWMCLFTRWW